jgi:hypothetical protein
LLSPEQKLHVVQLASFERRRISHRIAGEGAKMKFIAHRALRDAVATKAKSVTRSLKLRHVDLG